MKKLFTTIIAIIALTTISVHAESLFTLGATQHYQGVPRSLFGGVQARQIGDLISIIMSENISVNVNPSEYAPPVTTTTTVQTIAPPPADNTVTYVLNTNTKKIHYMSCSSVDSMKEHNKAFTTDYNKAIAEGYKPCKRCNP